MNKSIPVSFDIQITDKLVPYEFNPHMSKTRVSVFRKGGNANGSYFTDEVAEKMVAELPGSPIIGRYIKENNDFSSHLTIDDTRAYGFVPPQNYNFAWEKRTEQDGKEYDYACFDVVLWTERYEEANLIPSKGQSMELNPRTIVGDWRELDGQEYFVYDSCTVFGLCVLGDKIRPCFDEACFYEAKDGTNIETILFNMKEEIKNNFTQLMAGTKGGMEEMAYKVNLPQDEKIQALFDAVNSNVDENGDRIVDYALINVADDHIEYGNISAGDYKSVSYSLDENGAVVLGDEANYSVMNLSADEKKAFDAFAALDTEGNSIVKAFEINEHDVSQLTADLNAANAKIEKFTNADYEAQISDLNAKIADYETRISEYEKKENEAIAVQKDNMINEYSELVDADVLEDVKENKDAYSLQKIESMFAINFARKNKPPYNRVPSLEGDDSNPTLKILNDYKKRKGE